jgi:hypothetical protein
MTSAKASPDGPAARSTPTTTATYSIGEPQRRPPTRTGNPPLPTPTRVQAPFPTGHPLRLDVRTVQGSVKKV